MLNQNVDYLVNQCSLLNMMNQVQTGVKDSGKLMDNRRIVYKVVQQCAGESETKTKDI